MFEHIRIRSRKRLVGAMVAAQFLALSAGGFGIYHVVQTKLGENLRAQVHRQHEAVAMSLSRIIGDEYFGGVESFSPGSRGWEHVRMLVQDTVLADGAFACVIDSAGRAVCHEDADPDSHPAGIEGGSTRVNVGGEFVEIGSLVLDGPAHATLSVGGEMHFLTIVALPAVDGRLVVQQPESGLRGQSAAITGGIMWMVGAMTVVLAGVAVLFSSLIVRRYDSRVDELNRNLELQVVRRTRDAVARLHALIHGLAQLADRRDNETGSHLERICAYSCLLAEAVRDEHEEIDDDWISCLRLAASMHDIGKVGVPDRVLLKPGKLDEEEWESIREHPVIGATTLEAIHEKLGDDPLIDMAIDVTRSHHERWDGKGYPDGKSGTEIPISARIVTIADVYDALTSERVYKRAMSHAEASKILREGAGTQFDPELIEAFARIEAIFESIRRGLQDAESVPEAGDAATRAAA